MPERNHSYGLDWIDEEALFEVTKHCFSGVITKAQEARPDSPPDPFTIMVQAVIFDQDAQSMMAFEKLRFINKSISNAVGNWHQSVLGLAEGWESLGTAGGVVDLIARETPSSKPIYIEVKNRFNTIKASDEKEMWDKLDVLAKAHDTTAYLVQIVPKTPQRYDRPWNVSGRTAKETIRCCDGVTIYEKAFKKEHALKELYHAFPSILEDVIGTDSFNASGMQEYFALSLPLN